MGELERHHQQMSRTQREQAERHAAMRARSNELAQEFVNRMTAHRVGKTALYEVRHTQQNRHTFWKGRTIVNHTYDFDHKGQGWLLGCTDQEWHRYLFLMDDLRAVQTSDMVHEHPAPNAPPTPFVAVSDFDRSLTHTFFQHPHNLDFLTNAAFRLAP